MRPPADLHFTAGAVCLYNRASKNKHQAVSQGVQRFGKRSILLDM
jgi:hypothetical protein